MKKGKNIKGLLLVSVLLSVLPLIVFLPNTDNEYLKSILSNADGLASTFSLIFSTIGSFLVYYAFKEQIKANRLTQKQFRYAQITGLVENLSNRIINYTIERDKNNISGYAIFNELLLDIVHQQKDYATNMVATIFVAIPEKIRDYHYKKFIEVYLESESSEDAALKGRALKDELINQQTQTYNDYLETLDFTNFEYGEFTSRDMFWKDIVKSYFFEMEGEFRMNIYELALRPITVKYDMFLDMYFGGVFAILDSIHESKDKGEFLKYINNVFTNQERILLYHKMMSGTTTRQFGIYLLELGIFNMTLTKRFFISPMTKTLYEKEIEYIKPLIYRLD